MTLAISVEPTEEEAENTIYVTDPMKLRKKCL